MVCCVCCGGGKRRQRCARLAGMLLTHANLLLVLYSGAGLGTAARLKWDPSTYIPVREALPKEYPFICAALLAGSLLLLLLAHVALAALALRVSAAARRPLLYTYAGLMSTMVLAEVGVIVWVVQRVLQFLNSPAAAHLKELVEVRDHLKAALEILARLYPLPEKIYELVKEAVADAPRNGYVAVGAAIALLILQPAAVALALLAARPPRAPPPPRARLRPGPDASSYTLASVASADAYAHKLPRRPIRNHNSDPGKSEEGAPLRTAYKKGRLVML